MRQRNRQDTRTWLEEVQRDPRTLGAVRARIERLLSDPVVARSVAARLERGDALFAAEAGGRLPVATHAPEYACASSPAESALAPVRDFIVKTDGCLPGPDSGAAGQIPGPGSRARNPSLPGWFGTSAA